MKAWMLFPMAALILVLLNAFPKEDEDGRTVAFTHG